MPPKTSKTKAVGDRVMFEGLVHHIAEIDGATSRVAFESVLRDSTKPTRPRFRTAARLADLRWSDELNAWYLWGRLLSKARGGIGTDDRAIVAELRDRGMIPARERRRHGQAPAGGEHVNLLPALFSSGVDWRREIDSVRAGRSMSVAALDAIDEYKRRFKRKLVDGYSSPDADDSWSEE